MAVKMDPRMEAPLDSTGPGAYLRDAREEANMTVEKVAAALLLHVATVEAIEADAYDRLPAPTFVRGYLRGYARVLGLPSGPVLEMYDRQGFEPPPLTPEVTESKQAHTSDAVVRLVTYAVVVVLVLLVGLWWHSQEDRGFGISGDLFDWSAATGRDRTAADTDEAGATPGDGDADDTSIATASERMEALSQGDEFMPPSPVGDTATGDADAAQAPPDAVAAAGATDTPGPLPPDEPSRDEESAVTAPVEEVATGGVEVVDPAPADAPIPEATEDREPPATRESESRSPAEADAGAGTDAEPEAGAGDDVDAGARAGSEDNPGAETDSGVESEADAGTDSEIDPGVVRPDSGVPARAGDSDAAGSGDAPAPRGPDGTNAGDGTAGTPLPAAPAPETAGTTANTAANAGAEPGQSGLVMEFEHESWVEVYDRERNRLFFGLVRPGRVLGFDGPQPFDVLLGFGKDVRVTIDGNAFDHTPYLRHGVARFSVGSAPGADAEEPSGTAAPDAENDPVARARP